MWRPSGLANGFKSTRRIAARDPGGRSEIDESDDRYRDDAGDESEDGQLPRGGFRLGSGLG
jgi:hypothetical protein